MTRRDGGWSAAIALAAMVMTIPACGTTTAASRASGAAAACPAMAPTLTSPRAGTRVPVMPPGAITATICQYAPSLSGSKAAHAPLRRLLLRGQAAAGLLAVLNGTDPMTQPAVRCDRVAALLPFDQAIYFGYRDGRTARAVVTFTTCELAVVTAADRFGVLPSPVQDDLFGYTLITAHDRGPLVPEVIGLAAASAARVAQRHHFTLTVDGEAIDPAVPLGTVIFQVLPPAVQDAGPSPDSLGTIVGVRSASNCRASQLRLSYRAGGASAGSDFGEIMFRDVAAAPCRLAGRLQVTGVSAAGRLVTSTVTASIATPGVLGPNTPPVRDLAAAPPASLVYTLSLMAAYRDDAASPTGICTAHVIPARWLVRLPGGSVVIVPNADSGSAFRLLATSAGLVTCRGRLGAANEAAFAG